MADETAVIKIQYDTEEAISHVNKLTDAIANNQARQVELKQMLKDGKISQKDYATQISETTQTLNRDGFERKKYINIIQSEIGSVKRAKAENQMMREERNKLSTATEEGRKKIEDYNKKIDKNTEYIKANVDGQSKMFMTLGKVGDSLKSMPGPLGNIISGIGGMTKAALAFIATPIGMVIAALGLAIKALISYFKGSEEGQNRLNKVVNVAKAIWEALMDVVEKVGEIIFDAISKPKETIQKLGELIKENLINRFKAFGEIGKAIVKIFKGDFKEGFKQLAEGGIQAVTGVTNAFDKMKGAVDSVKNALKGLSENVNQKMEQAKRMSDLQARIDKEERKMLVEREKTRVEVDELLLAAKKKDMNNETERLAILQKASKMIDTLATAETKLAQDRLKAAQLRLQIEGDTKENLDAVAQAEADVISKKAEGLEARRKMEGQISQLILSTKDEVIAAEDEKQKAIIMTGQVDAYTNEEYLIRRGEAINKLADLKRQEQMIEEENFAKLRDLQIADEEARWEFEKSNTELTNEEREVLDQEHKMRLAEINQEYLDKVKEQREEDLKSALDAMNAIIASAQGMADKRVTIGSQALAKLATINYKEIKDAKDGFLAIGTAAAGLSALVVGNHDKELADLQTKKDAELALVGDNKEAQEQINKKYAKKEQEVKKKQFEDDKKKALIDAAIATALAVVKALQMGMPIGLVFAALAAVLGGIQIAAISKQKYTPAATYAEGGAVIGGKPHSLGGTKFYGEDGTRFEAEKGEGVFVLKKDATAEIAAYSQLNESYGGRSWTGQPTRHLAEGGEVSTGSIEKSVDEAMQRTPIFVRIGDIETGMTDYSKTKKAGVI
jgi:hypothetical protein